MAQIEDNMQITEKVLEISQKYGVEVGFAYGRVSVSNAEAEKENGFNTINFAIDNGQDNCVFVVKYVREMRGFDDFNLESIECFNLPHTVLSDDIKALLPDEINTQNDIIRVIKALGLALAKVDGFSIMECSTPEALKEHVSICKTSILKVMNNVKFVHYTSEAKRFLDLLVEAGMEFPDAESKVLAHFTKVSQEELTLAYDH